MDFKTVFSMIIAVISNKYVIITFVGVAAYISFINYVLHYRKSSVIRRSRVKKAIQRAEEQPEAPAEGQEPEE